MPYNFKQYLKPLLILFLLSIILAFYNQTDAFILGLFDESKAEVGSYTVGLKGIEIIIGIIAALSTVFIPRSTYYYSLDDKRFFNNLNKYSVNICFFIVLPAIITMAGMSSEITSLIGGRDGYTSSGPVLIILASMMLTYSLGDMIYGQILIPMKKEKYYLWAMGGGAILNIAGSIGLSYLFISLNKPIAVGVATATVVTDLLILIFLIAITWKWSKRAIFNLNTAKLVAASALILVITILLVKLFPISTLWAEQYPVDSELSQIFTLLSVLLIDAAIYVGSLLLMKEDLVYSFIRKKKPAEQ